MLPRVFYCTPELIIGCRCAAVGRYVFYMDLTEHIVFVNYKDKYTNRCIITIKTAVTYSSYTTAVNIYGTMSHNTNKYLG